MPLILGIDPGLAKTGWGLIEQQGNRLRFLGCGHIKTNPKDPLPLRLAELVRQVTLLAQECQPDACAIEETFVNKNAQSSLKLGHARGAIMAALSLQNAIPLEYSTRLIKKSVTGNGAAEKAQVAAMVQRLLPSAKIKTEDESDALAVAICHSHHLVWSAVTVK